MGNDFGWVIPVVAVVVWIIGSIWRNAEAAKKAQAAGPRPPQRPKARTSEIDRFLEEINRRRQAQAAPPAVTEEPTPPKPVPQRPRPPVRPRPVAAKPKPVPRPATPPPLGRPVVIEAEAVEIVVPPRQEHKSPLASKIAAGELRASELLKSSPAPRAYRSPALVQVMELLQSPQGFRSAVMLTEVLGPPRSRRRGRLL
jgi:hypothetical protein